MFIPAVLYWDNIVKKILLKLGDKKETGDKKEEMMASLYRGGIVYRRWLKPSVHYVKVNAAY